MTSPWRVRGRGSFDALRRTRHRARSGPVWVAWVPAPADSPGRVAFAIGRRTGGAVVRNRIRRRLRAAVATVHLPPGDLLIGCSGDIAGAGFAQLQAQVGEAVRAVQVES